MRPRNWLVGLVVAAGLSLVVGVSAPVAWAQNKVGINITDNLNVIDRAVSVVNADGNSNGGWIVVMPKIGNCTELDNIFKTYQSKTNFIIRLHYPSTVPDERYALSWAATLGKLAASTNDVIYVYPWNEPNMPRECGGRSDCSELVRVHVAKLREYLTEMGLWNTKIKVLSPMVNQSGGNFSEFVGQMGAPFFSQFAGEVMNLYDFEKDFGGQACKHPDPRFNACLFDQVLPQITGAQAPAYAVEVGIVDQSGRCPAQVTDCPFFEDARMLRFLREAFDNYWFNNPAIAMASPLFYDPEDPAHPVWLWGGQTERYLKEVAARRSGSTTTATYDKAKVDQFINKHLADGSLKQCPNSCGLATGDDLCTAAAGSTGPPAGYDLSQFDDYNANQDQFYIQPVRGVSQDTDTGRSTPIIRTDLIRQGYEAHCATPQFKIGLEPLDRKWMQSYIWNSAGQIGTVFGGQIIYPSRGIDTPYRSTMTVDYRELLAPLMRDVTGKRFLTSSIEEFFGFKDTVTGESTQAEINSAPINSLTTNMQRCRAAAAILVQQETMCNKLQDPTSCALYPRPIPETEFTVKSLLDAYKTAAGNHGAVMQGPYNDAAAMGRFCDGLIKEKWDNTLLTGLLSTPLVIDRAYRLAFLVTVIDMKYGSEASFLNLFEHPNAGFLRGGPHTPRQGVLVTAFKVPDITTNKGENSTRIGSTYWQDAALLTRNSLLTTEQRDDTESTAAAKRQELEVIGQTYNTTPGELGGNQTSADPVFCVVGDSQLGIGAPECRDHLSKAVIDIINSQAKAARNGSQYNSFDAECPTLEKEYSQSIADAGTLQPLDSADKLYSTEFGARLLQQLFIDSSHEITANGERDPSFSETWREGDPTNETSNPWGGLLDWGLKSVFHVIPENAGNPDDPNDGFPYCCTDAIKVKHYLVYPEGYDLTTVQNVLAGSFNSTSQLEYLNSALGEAGDYDRFQVRNDEISFEAAEKTVDYRDSSTRAPNWPIEGDEACAKYVTDPMTGEVLRKYYALPCNRSFTMRLRQEGEVLAAGILGGRLGYWMRSIQKSLNNKVGIARTYLDACQTTEQFLTGRCGEDTILIPTPTPDDCVSCSPPVRPDPPDLDCPADQPYLDIGLSIEANRNWWIDITCPLCTDNWGDIHFNAFPAGGGKLECGPSSLPVGGRFHLPVAGCSPGQVTVPSSFASGSQFCVRIELDSRPAGDQCQQDRVRNLCAIVP